MATEEQRHEVSTEELGSLSKRLQEFSKDLPEAERTVLTSILVLAGQGAAAKEHRKEPQGGKGASVQLGDPAAFHSAFASAFGHFAPGAFGGPIRQGAVAAGTVCVE
jgi:hypothetical protein